MNKLHNLRVLLTRQPEQNTNLCLQITQLGGIAVQLPLFTIEPLLDPLKLRNISRGLSLSCLAIFISRNAAQLVLTKIALPVDLACACIGPATAQFLRGFGLSRILYPQQAPYDSASLFQELELNNLNLVNQYIMIFSGEDGNSWLAQNLRLGGAIVEEVAVYKRVMAQVSQQVLEEVFILKSIDIILITCVTSLNGLKNLISPLNIDWQSLPLLVVSARIREQAQLLGFNNVFTAASMDQTDIISTLLYTQSQLDLG